MNALNLVQQQGGPCVVTGCSIQKVNRQLVVNAAVFAPDENKLAALLVASLVCNVQS